MGSRSQEKNITLSVAKKFGKLVEDNYKDVKVIYTRTTDVDISLAERAHIANRNKADLFISIHANSHPTSAPSGVETFVMGLSESHANLEVAKKENADILLEADYKTNKDYNGFDPNSPESYIIFSMVQNAYLEKSLNLAQAIQNQYKSNLRTINRGVKQAELFVLYKTTCPSVLTEIGFISNPTEETYMLSDEGQAQIAICLFNAFMNFKSAEEGIQRIENPKIDIPGYNAQQDVQLAKKEERPKPEIVYVDDTASVEVEPAPAVQTPRTVGQEPEPEPVKEQPQVANAVTPNEKPVPTATLPPVEEPKTTAPKPEPVPEPKAEPKPKPEPQPVQAPAVKEPLHDPQNTLDESASSFYTVQFLTVGLLYNVGAPQLEGIKSFSTFRQGVNYAYITGRFRTMKEAQEYCNHIRRATSFKDAWPYLYKGPALQTAEQPKATEQKPKPASAPAAATTSVKGLRYHVQFCLTTVEMQAGHPELQGIKDIQKMKIGTNYAYYAGSYGTMIEAQARCNAIRNSTTFKDAFVMATYNGERITIERARELEKGMRK